MQKGSALKVVVLVVAIVVIVLALWMSKGNKLIGPTTSPTSSGVKVTGSPQPSAKPASTAPEVDKLLKVYPGNNASQEKVAAFFEEVSKVGVFGDVIDVGGCSIKPPIVKIKKGSTITFKNSDSAPHKLTYPDWSLDVAAKSEAKLKVTGGGVQGYNCDSSAVGLLYIIE